MASNVYTGGIIRPIPNFNGCTVEVWEWIYHFIPYYTLGIIITLILKLIYVSQRGPWIHFEATASRQVGSERNGVFPPFIAWNGDHMTWENNCKMIYVYHLIVLHEATLKLPIAVTINDHVNHELRYPEFTALATFMP